MQILGLFKRCFYSLKALPFFLELYQTLLIDPFCIKRKVGKSLNFLTKPWSNPFGKMQILDRFLIDFFTTQIQLPFVLKHLTTFLIALLCIRKNIQ